VSFTLENVTSLLLKCGVNNTNTVTRTATFSCDNKQTNETKLDSQYTHKCKNSILQKFHKIIFFLAFSKQLGAMKERLAKAFTK